MKTRHMPLAAILAASIAQQASAKGLTDGLVITPRLWAFHDLTIVPAGEVEKFGPAGFASDWDLTLYGGSISKYLEASRSTLSLTVMHGEGNVPITLKAYGRTNYEATLQKPVKAGASLVLGARFENIDVKAASNEDTAALSAGGALYSEDFWGGLRLYGNLQLAGGWTHSGRHDAYFAGPDLSTGFTYEVAPRTNIDVRYRGIYSYYLNEGTEYYNSHVSRVQHGLSLGLSVGF